MPVGIVGEPAGGGLDVAVEGDVDVDHVAAEDRVANRAADEPGAIGDLAQPRAGDLDRRSLAEALLEPGQMDRSAHRRLSSPPPGRRAGTRRVSPQGIS